MRYSTLWIAGGIVVLMLLGVWWYIASRPTVATVDETPTEQAIFQQFLTEQKCTPVTISTSTRVYIFHLEGVASTTDSGKAYNCDGYLVVY